MRAFPERFIPYRVLVWRGVTRRCGRCGGGELFRGWWSMAKRCPTCHLVFEREHGYWLGAMTITMIVTEGLFVLVLVGLLVATWPDVPWGWVLVTLLALNAIVPMAFYPISQTMWVALERGVRARVEAAG